MSKFSPRDHPHPHPHPHANILIPLSKKWGPIKKWAPLIKGVCQDACLQEKISHIICCFFP